jgi:hypothetical protein
MKQIDRRIRSGVANVTNTLNVQGIDQNTKNQQLQLQILEFARDMGRMSRNEADQRSQQIVRPRGFRSTRICRRSRAHECVGRDNASSLISSLLNLGGLNLEGHGNSERHRTIRRTVKPSAR